jgi:hypothetical protein
MAALPLVVMVLAPTIWIVDAANGPGTSFTDLPPAIAVAASGDTIIVRPGSYSAFNVAGKVLTIRGAGTSSTLVNLPAPPGSSSEQSTIDAVPAGSVFYVSGMAFTPPTATLPGAVACLRVLGSSTEVVLADVAIVGPWSGVPIGLFVNGGATVHASRCSMAGGTANAGVQLQGGSRLAAEASIFAGGASNPAIFNSPGGAGLYVQSGTATVARSSAFGGSALVFGGHGIIVGPASALRVAGTSADMIQGGAASSTLAGHAVSVDVAGTAVIHGNVTLLAGGPSSSVTAGPVTIGAVPLPYLTITGTATAAGELLAAQPVTVTFDGVIASAPFACLFDVVPTFSTAFAPLTLGELLVPVPAVIPFQATLDAAGMFQLSLTPAASVSGLTGIPVYLQFGVLDGQAGQIRLSNGHIRFFN